MPSNLIALAPSAQYTNAANMETHVGIVGRCIRDIRVFAARFRVVS